MYAQLLVGELTQQYVRSLEVAITCLDLGIVCYLGCECQEVGQVRQRISDAPAPTKITRFPECCASISACGKVEHHESTFCRRVYDPTAALEAKQRGRYEVGTRGPAASGSGSARARPYRLAPKAVAAQLAKPVAGEQLDRGWCAADMAAFEIGTHLGGCRVDCGLGLDFGP